VATARYRCSFVTKPRSSTFCGDHYARLTRVEDRYDPGGLFFVHHGVGTET
jgi:hypothetical protein